MRSKAIRERPSLHKPTYARARRKIGIAIQQRWGDGATTGPACSRQRWGGGALDWYGDMGGGGLSRVLSSETGKYLKGVMAWNSYEKQMLRWDCL